MNPIVSVVVPTYNHAEYVLDTLRSVFCQTFRNFEVIVVNDGSKDRTNEVLAPLADRGAIQYVVQRNQGQAAARNRGASIATGDYIAFLDDDDLWPPEKLDWQVEALNQHPEAVLVYGYGETFGGTHPLKRYPCVAGPSGRVAARFLEESWMLSPGQCLIRAAAFRRVGGFDDRVWGADDWDLYLKLANIGVVTYMDLPALAYRVHEANASKRVLKHFLAARSVFRRHTRGYSADQRATLLRSMYTRAYFEAARGGLRTACRERHVLDFASFLLVIAMTDPNWVFSAAIRAALRGSRVVR